MSKGKQGEEMPVPICLSKSYIEKIKELKQAIAEKEKEIKKLKARVELKDKAMQEFKTNAGKFWKEEAIKLKEENEDFKQKIMKGMWISDIHHSQLMKQAISDFMAECHALDIGDIYISKDDWQALRERWLERDSNHVQSNNRKVQDGGIRMTSMRCKSCGHVHSILTGLCFQCNCEVIKEKP